MEIEAEKARQEAEAEADGLSRTEFAPLCRKAKRKAEEVALVRSSSQAWSLSAEWVDNVTLGFEFTQRQ